MKKVFVITTSALIIALAAPVLASSDDKGYKTYGDNGKGYGSFSSGNVQWMSPEEAGAKVSELDYTVRRIKRDDDYEVYVFERNDRAFELYLHRATGNIIKSNHKL